MKNRREFIWLGLGFGFGFVGVGCTTSDGRVGVPVNVTLPAEVTQIISESEDIIKKGKELLNNPTVSSLITQAEGYIGSLKSGAAGGSFKSTVGALATILGSVSAWLPAPYSLAAGVLVTIAKAYAGDKPIAARLPMSREEARRIMRS